MGSAATNPHGEDDRTSPTSFSTRPSTVNPSALEGDALYGRPETFRRLTTAISARPRAVAREKAYALCALIFIGDWVFSCLAIFAGLVFRDWQRLGWTLRSESLLDLRSSPLTWSLVGATTFVWLMALLHTYEIQNLYRLRRWSQNLVRSVLVWSGFVWAYIGLFKVTGYAPRLGVVYCALTILVLEALWRLSSFVFLVQPNIKESATSRILMVGWNDKVTQLWKAMRGDIAQLGEVVGSVPMPGGTFSSRPPAEVAVLGDYFDLPSLVAECQVDSIILSEVTCSAVDIESLIRFCQRELIGFRMVPEYFPAFGSGLQVQTLSGVPLLGVCHLPLDRTLNRMIKRSTDILGALCGLALSTLIVPVCAVATYLESPGPIFEWQRRISRGGKIFNICKMRTTEVPNKEISMLHFPDNPEPRILTVGNMMQRFYIDSLPRFFSVLVGDMSLVGPAPEQIENTNKLKAEIPNYSARHEIRPGLTGWAQIQGLQGDADPRKRIEADLYYLERWSVLLDIYCIMATLFRTRSLKD